MCTCVLCLVLTGYPPKPLSPYDTNASLTELGIRSGETLIVEERPPQSGTEMRSNVVSSQEEEKQVPTIARRFV